MTIDDFCARADKAFDLEEANSDYVEVLVNPQRDRLFSEEDAEAPVAEPVNPLIFLSGIRSSENSAYTMSDEAEAPSITLVIGTYGLGKTELMHQLCHHLRQNWAHNSSPKPLPLNLALCNPQVNILEGVTPPSGDDFVHFLFHHLTHDADDHTFVSGELLSAIAEGDVFLILDGLDELAITSRQYRRFFEGLSNMLRLGVPAAPHFRVVITMRYEYLMAQDSRDGEAGIDLVRTLREAPGNDALSIYFLRLDLFDDARVECYMDRRLPEGWFPQVSERKRLLEILYRPLLLRIFCDMASGPEGEQIFADLERFKNAAQLIDDYVMRAARDPELKRAQENIESTYRWEPDALANECLDLYLKGISSMRVENLRNILQPDASQASEEEVWRSIHKCPFLRRSGDEVFFTHRSFLEFFIAKGVSQDIEDSERKSQKFSAFDTLVLNVDTRKFLKSIVVEKESEEQWFRRTRRAYGLDDPGEWDPPYPQDLEVLDHERRTLLDAMTEPENREVNERARGSLSTFLARDHDRLHPRYLTYNYEAVAVFLKGNRGEALSQVRKDFGHLLPDRLEKTMAALAKSTAETSVLHNPRELLVERILSIALRLRYPWAPDYTEDSQKQRLEALIKDGDTKDRIFAILEDIDRTVFVRAM